MQRRSKSESVPEAMKARYDEVVELTDAFCREHLNEEYAQLCREMVATLARKRPSPLLGGKTLSWAAAVVYAIGSVNFLFSKDETPHMRANELAAAFGLAQSTVGNKAKEIKDLLNITVLDSRWTLPSRLEDNPMAWMVSINGLIIDARDLRRELQEEAYRKGLIPFIPTKKP